MQDDFTNSGDYHGGNMHNNSTNNGDSIYQGKVRPEDLNTKEKQEKLKKAAEELARRVKFARSKHERQASSCVDEISSQAELRIEEGDEDYFNGERERTLGDFWNFFESLFNLFEVDVDDPKIYQMLKEKKEKNWLLSIIKFMRDKLKELIKKIFARDLSFNQRLDKEIEELQAKLESGELSKEEFARVLERLEVLQTLKLKLQMAVAGWLMSTIAEFFGIDLAITAEPVVIEGKKEENKKEEKTSSKEAAAHKEGHEEMKADAKKADSAETKPIKLIIPPLELKELKLLPLEPLKNILPLEHKHDRVQENSEAKEMKRAREETEKEAKKPKVAAPQPATNAVGQGRKEVYECNSDWQSDKNSNSGQFAQKSIFDEKASKQSAKSPVPNGKTLRQSVKSSVANCGFDFNIGTWNGAKHEDSMNNAQPPKGLTGDVKVEKCVEGQSIGKTP